MTRLNWLVCGLTNVTVFWPPDVTKLAMSIGPKLMKLVSPGVISTTC